MNKTFKGNCEEVVRILEEKGYEVLKKEVSDNYVILKPLDTTKMYGQCPLLELVSTEKGSTFDYLTPFAAVYGIENWYAGLETGVNVEK